MSEKMSENLSERTASRSNNGNYSKILIAVDFHEDNAVVVQRAQNLADLHGSALHIVHVQESLGMAYAADSVAWGDQVYSLEASIRRENLQAMRELAEELGILEDACHAAEGRPATEIHRVAEDEDIDLIVMGTHGQSGLQLLLGSTASAVLHGANCDVLAVRIKG